MRKSFWHLVTFADRYHRLEMYRDEVIIPLGLASMVIQALAFMLATRTVHPPAGANPVIMVYAQAQWGAPLTPVLLGLVCLVCVAMLWSRAYPGLVHYPVSPLEPSPPSLTWGGWQ